MFTVIVIHKGTNYEERWLYSLALNAVIAALAAENYAYTYVVEGRHT
jgi:hypothetical protein